MFSSSHPHIIKRLKRADGRRRIGGGRPLLDIAQQLQAVEKRDQQRQEDLWHDHIDSCLELAVGDGAKSADAVVIIGIALCNRSGAWRNYADLALAPFMPIPDWLHHGDH